MVFRWLAAATLCCLLVALSSAAGQTRTEPERCTYTSYAWHTKKRRAVDRKKVSKSYADVTANERDPNDPRCTVCTEDQVSIDPASFGVRSVKPIRVCWAHASKVESALRSIAKSAEFEVIGLDGYRAGRTRGRVVNQRRTQWSNHSFGTAIDINAKHNGLYRSCNVEEVTEATLKRCRLGMGGAWKPAARPKTTIVKGGVVHKLFTGDVGWKWGGSIEGRIRDLMHFSLTGY